ncbi:MAG: hypothetical protein P8Z78_01785 [Gammaproteobacteria bacterium]|jgi:putative chitinase
MRKPIFDVIRAQRGKGFTQREVEAVDEVLDTLGIPRDEAPVVTPKPRNLPETLTAPHDTGLEDASAFISAVKASLFSNKLKPDQKKGLEAILSAATEAKWPLAFVSYGLATAYHETAFTMQPVVEAFWLSESWRERNLRYYPYHGRGYVQLTWESNYEKADKKLGLEGRLLANLDLALDPDIAARIMVKGMEEGWFCGDRSGKRHTLKRHVPTSGPGNLEQYKEARRIINGRDKAATIAKYALKFQDALKAGGW